MGAKLALAIGSLLVSLFVASLFLSPVEASGGPIVRTIVVETVDVDAYRDAIEEGSRIMSELGVTPEIRVDPHVIERENGLFEVRVLIEYPDRAARDAWGAKLEQAGRYRTWLESLDELRRVLSDRERERRGEDLEALGPPRRSVPGELGRAPGELGARSPPALMGLSGRRCNGIRSRAKWRA